MQAPPLPFIPVELNRASGRAFFRLPFSRLPFFLTLAFFLPAAAFSQGFGTIRGDKVVLHRKLPAVIHLTGTTISVKTTAHTAQQNDTAQLLTELLQTNLMKYDKTLTVDENSPNVKIQCTITNFEIPAPQQYTKDDTILVKGKPTAQKRNLLSRVGDSRCGRASDGPRRKNSGFEYAFQPNMRRNMSSRMRRAASPSERWSAH